jgi:minor histocompatibility antigen H13
MMVTVATSLDVPIKLIFPGPVRSSVLGLGDIVVPGIVIALALRFDLYLFYLRKQGQVTASSTGQPGGDSSVTVKVPYVEATGRWGERFWMGRHLDLEGGSFPKVYFNAAITGYIVGLIMTLVVMSIFKHAQPALLYLVPSVLGALWGTAFLRGEIDLMWNYTEAEETGDAAKTDLPETRNPSTSAHHESNNVLFLSLDAPLARTSHRKSVDKVSLSRRRLSSMVISDVPMSPEDHRRGRDEAPPEKRRKVE